MDKYEFHKLTSLAISQQDIFHRSRVKFPSTDSSSSLCTSASHTTYHMIHHDTIQAPTKPSILKNILFLE